MNEKTIETVSPDVLKLISKKLSTPDVLKWCLTSKRFKKIICDSDSTWIDRIKKDDGVDITKLKKIYVNRYIKLHQIGDEILELSKELLLTDDDKLDQEINVPVSVIRYFKNVHDMTITRKSKRMVLNHRIMILLTEYLKLATRAQYFHVEGFELEYRDIQFRVIVKKEGLYDYGIDVEFARNNQFLLNFGISGKGVYLSDIFKIMDYIAEQNEKKGLFYHLIYQINEIRTIKKP